MADHEVNPGYDPNVLVLEPRGDFRRQRVFVSEYDVPTFVCRACGGDRFRVGQVKCATFVHCLGCGVEGMVHEG